MKKFILLLFIILFLPPKIGIAKQEILLVTGKNGKDEISSYIDAVPLDVLRTKHCSSRRDFARVESPLNGAKGDRISYEIKARTRPWNSEKDSDFSSKAETFVIDVGDLARFEMHWVASFLEKGNSIYIESYSCDGENFFRVDSIYHPNLVQKVRSQRDKASAKADPPPVTEAHADSAAAISKGIGVLSCRDYVRSTDNNKDMAFSTWAIGYMSGMNVAFELMKIPRRRDLSGYSTRFIADKIADFCAKHPGDLMETLALEAYLELPLIQESLSPSQK